MIIIPSTCHMQIPSLAYVTTVSSGTDGTSFTFAGTSIGTASADRYVVAGVHTGAAGSDMTQSAVTIGGVSASRIAQSNHTGAGQSHNLSFWIALVPTGTAGDIVITTTNTTLRANASVWTIRGIKNKATVFSQAADVANLTTASINLNMDNYGTILAICRGNNSPTFSWTGVTERFDAIQETVGFSSGDAGPQQLRETPRTVSCTRSAAAATDAANALAICLS